MSTRECKWKPRDRVRIRDEHDPMHAFNVKYGFTSPNGTVDSWHPDTGLVYVVFDNEDGEAMGAMAPCYADELEAARSRPPADTDTGRGQ